MDTTKANNKKEEEELLQKAYKKVFNEYQSNMEAYDREVAQNTMDIQKTQIEYDDTYSDLLELKEEFKLRLQEKKKRDEIAAIMKKKNDDQNEKKDRLSKASEFIQAHWRGLLARKDMEKARKGKKKKKKK